MDKCLQQKMFQLIILMFIVFMTAFYVAQYERSLADERDVIEPRTSLNQQSVSISINSNLSKLLL